MSRKKLLIGSGAAIVLAAGGAGAIAATKQDERKEAETRVLSDAAKKLNVSPEDLRSALGTAQDAEIDREVAAGRLTKEQADEIKKRRAESGTVLGGGPGRGGPGHGRFGGPGGKGFGFFDPGLLREGGDVLAKALGISTAELRKQFEADKTVAEIAKAQNKDLADVKAAVKKAAIEKLDQAVKDDKLTKTQRDELADRLDEMIARLGDFGGKPKFKGFRGGPGHGGPGAYPGQTP